MKKSKIKMLTASACLALVGTASAAWVYAGTATASANIGVKVASYASAGSITVSNQDNIYVYLDNNKVSYKYADESKPFSATYVKPSDVTVGSETVTKYFGVSIPKALAAYVTFADSTRIGTASDGTVYYKADKSNPLPTWTDGNDLIDSLPALAWVSGKCPTGDNAKSAYATMINALCGENTVTAIDDSNQNSEWNVAEDLSITVTFYAAVNLDSSAS